MTREQHVRIVGLMRRMREALAKADEQEQKSNELKEAFKVKFATEQRLRRSRGQVLLRDVEKDQRQAENVPLKDAVGGQDWWRRQAEVLAAVVQAEIAYARAMEAREHHA